MQPMLSITAPAPGMIYINGRFAGESSAQSPLLAPVLPFGAVYLEYHPLAPGHTYLTRKIVMSGGVPMKDSLAEDLFILYWPCGISEIELSPEETIPESVETFSLDGIPCRILRSKQSRLEIGALSCPFPRKGALPQIHRVGMSAVLTGTADDKCYILTLSGNLSHQTGFLMADRLEFEDGNTIRATLFQKDIAGHASQERWQLTEAGPRLLETKPAWEDGRPRTPASAEETALACIEAALLGLYDEAEEFLSPALRGSSILQQVSADCSGCLPMKYSSGGCTIALAQTENGSFARIRELEYRAERVGCRWLLTALTPTHY